MVDPVSSSSQSAHSSPNREQETKKALQLLQNMDVLLFFTNILKEEKKTSSHAGDSLQQQIENVEKELAEGKITVIEAINDINKLIANYESQNNVEMPQFSYQNPNNSAERIAEQVFSFQSFVKLLAEKEGSPIENSKTILSDLSKLADNIHTGKTPAQEGLALLIGKIEQVNKNMPHSLHYPIPPTTAYL